MNFRRLDAPSLEALAIAQSLAVRRGHSEVDPEHLLLALLRQPGGFAPTLLAQLGASPEELSAAARSSFSTSRIRALSLRPPAGCVLIRLETE